MRTILVIYSNVRVSDAELKNLKKYAFNVDDDTDVNVGDILKSAAYSTRMVVVRVLDERFKYYNAKDGKLSNTFNYSGMADIKLLKVVEEIEDVVVATKVETDIVFGD